MILALLIPLIALLYAAFIWRCAWAWRGMRASPDNQRKLPGVTVVVAARNEAHRIQPLLEAMRNQSYPADRLEWIVSDDHSTDGTPELVRAFIQDHALPNARLLTATGMKAGEASPDKTNHARGPDGQRIQPTAPPPPGKKAALERAIQAARGEIILTTDADVRPNKHWVNAMARSFSDPEVGMVLGPVRILPGSALFGKMQALEFLSLMGVTGGTAAMGQPLLCNGANLAFRKGLFEEAGGYGGHRQYVSGDDVFLMHRFKRMDRVKIRFAENARAMVDTPAVNSLGAFFRQRRRWAGKSVGYQDPATLMAGLLVALFNLLLATTLIFLPFLSGPVREALLAACILKALADLALLVTTAGYFKQITLLWLFPPLFLIYPFYVIATLLGSLFKRNTW